MPGDDDEYDFDDFDDATLNAAYAIEKSYLAATTTHPTQHKPSPPPVKRPRTENWGTQTPSTTHTNRSTIRKTNNFDGFGDEPDITIVDGSYVLTQSNPRAPAEAYHPPPKPPDGNPSKTSSTAFSEQPTGNFAPNVFKPVIPPAQPLPGASSRATPQVQPVPPRPDITQRSSSPAVVPSSQTGGQEKPKPATSTFRAPLPPAARPTQGRANLPPRITPAPGPSKPIVPSLAPQLTSHKDPTDFHDMRMQLELLQKETEALKASLKEAEEAKMMKEGEASNIKRLMEKQNHQFAESIEKLKAERDAKITAALKSQENLQATIEGLRSQLVFQKQDLEAASTKWNAAWGSAKKKPSIASQVAQTPRRLGAVAFGADAWGTTPQRPVSFTPLSQRAREKTPSLPKFGDPKPSAKSPKKSDGPQFPTFHNSFAKTTSPVKKRGEKGKGKSQGPPSSPTQMDVEQPPPLLTQRGANENRSRGTETMDEDEVASALQDEQQPAEPPPELWSIDWRRELHELLFSHFLLDFDTQPVPEAQPDLTLQVLFATTFPSDVDPELFSTFRQGCQSILATSGAHPRDEDWLGIVHDVANGIAKCVDVLTRLNLLDSLIPLLHLIDTLVSRMPPFSAEFLAAPTATAPGSSLIQNLVELVNTHLAPPPTNAKERNVPRPAEEWSKSKKALAQAILNVLDALAWNIGTRDTASSRKLIPFASDKTCLMNLLNIAQPTWVLKRTTRLLITLATHAILFTPLLGKDGTPGKDYDPTRLPLLQRLCFYLVIPHRWSSDVDRQTMSEWILGFFATLTQVDERGAGVLLESIWVLPSLVVFLMHGSSRLFEDDDALMDSASDDQLSIISNLSKALHLLWHLVKPWDPTVNLRERILEAGGREPHLYNGLHHQFMVALGRLSFADPPDWLPSAGKEVVTRMAELAQDLLDSVVEGPESDSIWEAYQLVDEEDQAQQEPEGGEVDEDLAKEMHVPETE